MEDDEKKEVLKRIRLRTKEMKIRHKEFERKVKNSNSKREVKKELAAYCMRALVDNLLNLKELSEVDERVKETLDDAMDLLKGTILLDQNNNSEFEN